ncbi:SBBP repeat-containing protein [Hyunsoonleella rubra]|uniref:SBBP repeat-containing protein n=1 Tax=Hyunsoonleella rubra TaxID=1737062 RepID=A0ABW5TFP3_9FLAO
MKKIYLTICLILLFICSQNLSQAQELIFAKRIGGDSPFISLERGNSIALDETGNLYVTGTIGAGTSGVVFGENEVNETTLNINGSFLAKYNNIQELQWVQQMGTSNNSITSYAIDSDASGNVYVSGTFGIEATFGVGQTNETTLTGTLGEIFIAKYDSNGNLLWAINEGGENDDNPGGKALIVDDSGNVYLTGTFWGTVTFGEGETTETTFTSEKSTFFLAKYDSNGALIWVQKVDSGSNSSVGKNLDLDEQENIYVTGNYFDSVVFGEGLSNEITLNDNNVSAFIAKYDNEGNFLWAIEPFKSGKADIGNDLAIDKQGSVFFTGSFTDSIILGEGTENETQLSGAGSDEIIVAKYNSEGEFIWGKTAESTGGDRGIGLAVDTASNVFITGYYGSQIQFGKNENNDTTITNSGSSDIFVAKFSSSGEFIWVTHAGGTNWEQGTDIQVDESGNAYVTGFYRSNITFGEGEPLETSLSIEGLNDIFISKFQRSNEPPQITAYNGVTSILKNETLVIALTDLEISDIDNSYPNDFTFVVLEGDNYLVNGNSVTPDSDFSGTISISITVNDGELDSEEFVIPIEVVETLGIDDLLNKDQFDFYPNPASNLINLIFDQQSQCQINIFSIKGDLVHSSIIGKISEKSIDITHLKTGVYLLTITTDSKYEIMKMIKK